VAEVPKRKFAALAELHHQPQQEDAVEETVASPLPVAVIPQRGRPPTGKRSDPAWKLYSHFLKRETQRAAVARLHAEDDGRDLSDVLQELLESWLKT
jgi:hypothetical protein